MNDTYVRSNPTEIIPRATQGYTQGEHGIVESGDLYAAYGAGGIYTTPNDLTKWLTNFESKQLGGAEYIGRDSEKRRVAVLCSGRAHAGGAQISLASSSGVTDLLVCCPPKNFLSSAGGNVYVSTARWHHGCSLDIRLPRVLECQAHLCMACSPSPQGNQGAGTCFAPGAHVPQVKHGGERLAIF